MAAPMWRSRKSMSTANDKLPRVSTILRVLDDAYLGVPQAALDHAAQRGTDLHALCQDYLMALEGVCEMPNVPLLYEEPYAAFVLWARQHQLRPVTIEEPSVSTKYGYRGTPDALVILNGKPTVLDLKFTASIIRTNRVQVQAYRRLDKYEEATQAVLLHINPVTGVLKHHLVPNSPHDWAAFLNALNVWKWRQI